MLSILIICRDAGVQICRKGVNQLGGWRYDTEIVVTARTKRCVRHIIAAKWRLSPLCHHSPDPDGLHKMPNKQMLPENHFKIIRSNEIIVMIVPNKLTTSLTIYLIFMF